MKKTVIRFGLSEREIDRTIKALEQYKRELIRKTSLLREKVAERIEELARSGFAGAVVDDLLRGGVKTAQVDVSLDNKDAVSLVIANGEDAVWVEFGSGVFANGTAGQSPHPKGQEFGFLIGEYGKKQGRKTVWGYYEDGELKLTHGTPATMPMYRAVREVCDNIYDIAKEVFS